MLFKELVRERKMLIMVTCNLKLDSWRLINNYIQQWGNSSMFDMQNARWNGKVVRVWCKAMYLSKCARFAPIVGCSINLKRFYFDDLTHILPNTHSTCWWWCWKLYEIRTASICFDADVNDPEMVIHRPSHLSLLEMELNIDANCESTLDSTELITGRDSNKMLTLHYGRWLVDEFQC